MIIDFHTHCFPDTLAPRAIEKLSTAASILLSTDGTVAGLKRSMAAAGIDKSVVLSIATKPEQTPTINRWVTGLLGDEAVIPFGALHPDQPGWKEEIAKLSEQKILGVKFHPDYQDFDVDRADLFPIYEELVRNELIILFHAGLDAAYEPPFRCTPDRLARVLDAFPNGKMVAAHLGGYKHWDEVEQHLVGRNVFLDTSFSLGHMSTAQWRRICDNHGYDKILFASDVPWGDQTRDVGLIAELQLPEDTRRKIMGENARRLLGL